MTPINKKVDTPQSPPPSLPSTMPTTSITHPGIWVSRVLLAVLWLFGTEFLFWNNPQHRSVGDWAFLSVGYLLLATLALDWIVRFRVRDIWGVFVVVGVFGLLNGVLLNPQQVFEQLPNTILSHALGGYWWIGLEMFGLWAFLHSWRGRNRFVRGRMLVIGAIVVGFFWGVWVTWLPVYNPDMPETTSYEGLMLIASLFLVVVMLLVVILHRLQKPLSAEDYRLDGRGSLLLLAGLLAIGLMQLVNDAYTESTGILVSAALLGIFWLVLWLRDSTRKPSMIIEVLPLQAPSVPLLMIVVVLFVLMTQVGTNLPLVSLPYDINQFSLLTVVFSGIGVVWIPVTTAVIGTQTFSRQLKTGKV